MKSLFCLLLLALTLSVSAAQGQRLIVLSPHAVEMLYEIGAGDNIIGTVDYADFPVAAKQIRRIGRHDYINYEAIMQLNPDRIVVSSSSTSAPIITRLEELGFTLVDSSVKQLDQIPSRLIELGAITGRELEAKESAARFSLTLADIKAQYQDLSPVDLFYQVWPAPLTTTSSSWMNEIFTSCGANNVFANTISEYPQVSLEQVLTTTPEIIIKPIHHGNSNQESVDWHKWPELPAVANKQIITIEGDLVHRTGPRVLQGMQQICEIVARARIQKNALAAKEVTL